MLLIIICTIFIATTLNIFLKKSNIPTIIGYIITGIIISYGFDLHQEANNANLKLIAEFGIVFLMFTIGLEFSVNHLLRMKKDVFLLGGLQFVITVTLIYLFMHYFGNLGNKASIIIASGLAMSSTAIVLKTLNENNDINKEYGQKSLGVLLFQDLAVIPVLLLIALFSKVNLSFPILLSKTILSGIGLVVVMFVVAKFLLTPFLDRVSKTNSNEIFIGAILFLVFGASFLSHELGLSYSLGALLAGIMIAETHFKHQIEADLIPFRDILLGIFFVTVGMQLNFQVIIDNIVIILSFLSFLVVVKIGVVYTIMRKVTKKITSVKTALTLFQFGEFGIVIFELATSEGILSINSAQILIVTVILSMMVTPFVLKNINFLGEKLINEREIDDKLTVNELSGHTVLIGYGRLGKILASRLDDDKSPYIILETDPKTFKEAKSAGKPVMYGNAAQKNILEKLNIKKAQAIIVSVGNNEKLYLVCQMLSQMAPQAKIIVKVNKYEEKQMLSNLKIAHIIVETEETANSMYASLAT